MFLQSRMSKNKYWLWWVATGFLSSNLANKTFLISLTGYFALATSIAAVLLLTSAAGKRLHDFGFSSKWAWITTMFVNLVPVSVGLFSDQIYKIADPRQIYWVLVVIGGIWHISLGVVEGDAGENKYGPAPEA